MNKSVKTFVNIFIFIIVIGFIAYVIRSFNTEERVLTQDPSIISFTSDYEHLLTIPTQDSIIAFDVFNEHFYVASENQVGIYDLQGDLLSDFETKSNVRDIKINRKSIFLLYSTSIEQYSLEGDLLLSWDACSDLSDYCGLTIVKDFVFVTDVSNKNICQYTREGNFVRFINSPVDFIIPSQFFDITSKNDTIYCSNPGRHRIESYTLDGDFITAFGKPGGDIGYFAGCCNPSYIDFDQEGNIFTSEKGNPRISSYNLSGNLNKLLLNNQLLGGGHLPYQLKVVDMKLMVAMKNEIKVFQIKNNIKSL
ncbi:NHL repeat-containing protein [Carboxylicivirga marina]|uniref:6-bladed beta-propeller n=1 Tax=Carboxylicivirga marina TaxID=2800988 RepID=A0ABS1HHL4_9BACT|nr:hypothetical protein [Carboxylicivirga marina]MBK3517115.1 hypothetical protein [Carboxylicivirga marina]